jgi:hypothetical protein
MRTTTPLVFLTNHLKPGFSSKIEQDLCALAWNICNYIGTPNLNIALGHVQ